VDRDQQAAEIDSLPLWVPLAGIPGTSARTPAGRLVMLGGHLLVAGVPVIGILVIEILVVARVIVTGPCPFIFAGGRHVHPALGHRLVLARLTAPPEHLARSL
jgi:hypothetical protein